jgi:hypothetical protein
MNASLAPTDAAGHRPPREDASTDAAIEVAEAVRAAVSSGMAPVCTSSDGGVSTRCPAAFTGLVGHEPSHGRIPRAHGFAEMTNPGALRFSFDASKEDPSTSDTVSLLGCPRSAIGERLGYRSPRPRSSPRGGDQSFTGAIPNPLRCC